MTRVETEPGASPRLVVVEEEPAEPSAGAPKQRRRGSRANWLLLSATLLFAWLWLHQLEQTRLLAGNLARARGEVAAARTEIVARDEHLRDVRAGIVALIDQVQALDGLAAQPPVAAPRGLTAPPVGSVQGPGAD